MTYKVVTDDNERCTAKSKTTGNRCRRERMPYINVCRYHGGNAPQVRAASERRLSEAKAMKQAVGYLQRNGIEEIEDPFGELMHLASEATAYREVFRLQVDKLLETDDIRYEGRAGEQLRSEIALWERSAERCLKIYSEIARLGIAERQVRVREAEIMLMAQAIRNILKRLNLNPAQKAMSGQVVSEELRAIEAPKPK